MKKWILFLLICLTGFMGVGIFLLLSMTTSPISRSTFERIREGMTLQEVEAMIGLPPGEYGTRSHRIKVLSGKLEGEFWLDVSYKKYIYWSSNDGEIIISVSPEGRTTGKMFYELEGDPPETNLELLSRWLRYVLN